ncbi:MAG: autotransporter-associated N-terminal domain-containing protein, partial [Streptobacillus sp.]
WQFGANTFQDFSVGKYKGTGDKAEKYPYEGIFTRSSNIYHRHISPESKKYEDVVSEMSKETKILSGLKYGLNTTKKVKEPIVELEFPATIRPKGGEEINLTKPSKENKVVIAKVELPHFEIPDDKTKPAPPTSARATNSSGKSLKTVISKADYANIKKGNGESGTLVGQMESDVAGPISQTNINGKNGKGKIEIIHNNTDEFTIKSENTIFTGIEGTDHHQVFTYDTNLNNKYKYEAETGPMIIRAGGGHNFEISNMNITSKGEIEEVITNIFELNAGDNQKTKLTLKENTDVVVDSNLTTVVKLTNHTSKSSLDFINEGKITVNNNNNYVSMIANMNSEKNMSYFENKGDIIINGKSNRGIIELKNSSYFFKNEGNLILDGEINYFLPSRAEAESIIQLNKPLKIIGKLNRGVILTPNIRKFDREYNGKLEKSYFNMELSGERNTGIYIFDPSSSIGNTVNIENFNLKSRDGKQNNLVVVNGLKNKIATLSKNGEHSNLEIIGGERNTAIQVAASQNVKNEGSIKLTDATSSTAIASRGLVDAKGEVTPASMTNEGKIEVSGNSTKALHSYDDGKIVNVGEITFNGSTSADGLGALAIYSNSSGEIESTANANITVDGSKSAGLFAKNKSTNPNLQRTSTIKISNANITAKNGAFNVFADKGGEITLNENNILNTENSSLTFFTNYNSAAPGGKIIFNNDVTANIKKGGTVFYYDLENAAIGNFNFANWYSLNFTHNNSSKLKLNMEDKSRLMLLANANLNLSEIPDNIQNSNLEINGNNYIPISIVDSKLNINSDINLDDASNKYNKMEIIRSSITNQNTISGTLNNQVAIAQENNNTNPSSKIVLENEGTINLTGDNSAAIYSKRGKINNKNEISIKNNSVGLHLEENNSLAIADGEIQNNGNISIGENSTAILYKGEKTGTLGETNGIYNNGHIISNSLNSIGMYFDSQFSTKEIINKNNGNIELNGADSIGMYGLGNGSYNLKNLGTIKLGSSKNKDTFSLGIYTKNSNATIYNNGNITMGDYGIGIYGSKITTDTASNVKVKNNSVAFYSTVNDLNLQGKVDVEGENSTGVLLSGSNQNLTANFGEMKIGNNSLGIVDIGVSNKITSNTSHVNLNNDSIYIYSKDSTGNIENNTEIKTIGDRNYSIYSSGKVINKADMDLRDGVGNIGIYSSGLAGAENYRTIKVGASQRNTRLYSMGMATGFYSSDDNSVTNIGKIVNKNTGKIVVEGDYGIGMYAVGQGSEAINDGEIILKGKNSIGMFLDQNAVGINNGEISATANAMKSIGAVVANGAVLKNYGTINILPSDGVGVW